MALSNEHWRKTLHRARAERAEETSRTTQLIEGRIVGWDPRSELITVASGVGPQTVAFPHPYTGVNAWVRSAPEVGSGVFLSGNADTNRWDAIGTVARFRTSRAVQFEQGPSAWRPLRSGEIDIRGVGGAGVFVGASGTLELSGGAVYGAMENNTLTHWVKAGLHTRRTLAADDSTLSGQERFGVVRRPVLGTAHPVKIAADEGERFAHEFRRSVTSEAGDLSVLAEGDIVDGAGELQLDTQTQRPLRLQRTIPTPQGDWRLAVDDQGNMSWRLPAGATTGAFLSAPNGQVRLRAGAGIELRTDAQLDARGETGVVIASSRETALLGRSTVLGSYSGLSPVLTLDDLNAYIALLRKTLTLTVQPKPSTTILVPNAVKARPSVFAGL